MTDRLAARPGSLRRSGGEQAPGAGAAGRGHRRRDVLCLALLLLLPAVAFAPALAEERLLGPGDGAALHYPLRAAVWKAYRAGALPSWNPGIFLGTPLLSSYRPGALHPLMLALAPADPFWAFQFLVLGALGLSGGLAFLYLRRIGAGRLGAYVGGLAFALGPYLVGHLDDTATLVAAPTLPLLLLAAESQMNREGAWRATGLALAVALNLLSGSPEAARAGVALLSGRLVVGHLFGVGPRGARPRTSALAALAGVLLAAPQLLPTVIAAREALGGSAGLATSLDPVPGATGLLLRHVSHSPAGALAIAALPLVATQAAIRVLGVALAICAGLQWGRGPLAAPGATALVFDFTLAILAGLSLDAQWRSRRTREGRRLRAYFLTAAMGSAVALSVAAATLGPLPESLAGAVGVLAVALILYFTLADHADPVLAGVFALPLTAAFLLQPQGRRIWEEAPTRRDLEEGTPSRRAVDRALGLRSGQPILSLVRSWPPPADERDLAYANLGPLSGRRSVNGYDPLVPRRSGLLFEGMGAGGALRGAFLRTDASRLELLGVRFVQAPASALQSSWDEPAGEALDLPLEPGPSRFFPLPQVAASELQIVSSLADAVALPQGEPVAWLQVRLASGRELLPLPLRAGVETAEWAWDRPDVTTLVAHRKPPAFESWAGPQGGFQGHRYLGRLPLPGRFLVDGVRIARTATPGRLTLHRLSVQDGTTGRRTGATLVASYLSDPRLRQLAAAPVALYELPGSLGQARVVERARPLGSQDEVLRALRQMPPAALDQRHEVLVAAPLELPPGSRASRADVVRAQATRMDLRAEGPGLLVVAESWDPGWTAEVDGQPAPVVPVNGVQMGVLLAPGIHRVLLSHAPRGFLPGLALCGLGAGLLALLRRPDAGLAGPAPVV